jgi:hypothetical protein
MPPLLLQLYAMRAQLECAIATIEQANGVVQESAPAPVGCPHPPERQRNASSFGEPAMVVCLECGLTRPGTADH